MRSTVRERIEAMDDFTVVRFFQHWSGELCDGAATPFPEIVDGVPPEIAGNAAFSALAAISPEEAVVPINPADSVGLVRALLEPLADTPEVGPTIAAALGTFHDEKLVVDVVLALGLVASVLLIVSTVEFEGTIGGITFRKGKVDTETLEAVATFVSGLLAPYTRGQ